MQPAGASLNSPGFLSNEWGPPYSLRVRPSTSARLDESDQAGSAKMKIAEIRPIAIPRADHATSFEFRLTSNQKLIHIGQRHGRTIVEQQRIR